MPTVSAYSTPMQYRDNLAKHPLELIQQTLMYKQQEFNNAYSNMQKLKQQALNIQFLNEDRQKEVDSLNIELDNQFKERNGEFGDLSNSKVQGKYLQWFDKIASNTDLIKAYHEDKQWQSELGKINQMKLAKDPTKAGYARINEAVFNNRLNEYVKSPKGQTPSFKGYTPYFDINGTLIKTLKALPPQKQVITEVDPNNPYRLIKKTINGYSKDQLEGIMGSIGDEGRTQLEVEAEYKTINGLRSNPEQYKANLFNQYQNKLQETELRYKTGITQLKQQLPLVSNEQRSVVEESIKRYEQGLADLGLNKVDLPTFLGYGQDKLLGIETQLHSDKKLSTMAESVAAKPSYEIIPNTPYIQQQDYNFKVAKTQQDNNYRNAQLALMGKRIELEALDLQRKERADQLEAQTKLAVAGLKQGKDGLEQDNLFSNTEFQSNDLAKQMEASKGYENIWETKNEIANRAFNVGDGANYKVEFQGRNMSNDQIIESMIKDPYQAEKYINSSKLGNNPTMHIALRAVNYLSLAKEKDWNGMSNADKVGAVKTFINQTLEEKPWIDMSQHADLQSFVSKYKNYKSEEINFNKLHDKAWLKVQQELGNFNTMTPEVQEEARRKVAQEFGNYDVAQAYTPIVRDYDGVKESPTKDNIGLFDERAKLSNILTTMNQGSFKGEFPSNLIRKVLVNKATGKVDVYLKNDVSIFDGIYKKEDLVDGDQTTKTIKTNVGEFDLLPGSIISFNDSRQKTDLPINRALENGNTITDFVSTSHGDIPFTFKKAAGTYYLKAGEFTKTFSFNEINGKSADQILQLAKQTLQTILK